MHWVELRSLWGKSLMNLKEDQLADAHKILEKYNLQVTDIASPLFKTDWPGAPRSQYGSKGDMHGAPETTFKEQDEILEKSIALAKQFKTNKVRCFDFWRLDDIKPYREAIDEKLRQAAEKAGKRASSWCWKTSSSATPPRDVNQLARWARSNPLPWL